MNTPVGRGSDLETPSSLLSPTSVSNVEVEQAIVAVKDGIISMHGDG